MKIRDEDGCWLPVEAYLEKKSEAKFSHGICSECVGRLYPQYADNEVGGVPPAGHRRVGWPYGADHLGRLPSTVPSKALLRGGTWPLKQLRKG